MNLSRRNFLGSSLAGGLLATTAMPSLKAAPAGPVAGKRARNIIFMISDGMSNGTLTMAEHYSRLQYGKGTHWLGLYSRREVSRGLMDTASANSLVTDSAASSSAWGGGRRVNNGAVNCAPDGTLSVPILERVAGEGFSTGLVTTATVTHATPAGFAAKVPARAEEQDIACQYLDRKLDVILGGGRKFFLPELRKDHRDLAGEFRSASYQVALDAAGLQAAPSSGRLLGLFDEGHMPYDLDRRNEPTLAASVPSLAEMTAVALQRLDRNPRGFVLQVEGARVDHGAHANDAGALLFDQLAFDQAVGVVLEWLQGRDDTLLIITSDHGNGNPGLFGQGGSYADTNRAFAGLARFRHTNTWVLSGLDAKSSEADISARIREGLDFTPTPDELRVLKDLLENEQRKGVRVKSSPLLGLGDLLGDRIAVRWGSSSHSSDFTDLASLGPGSGPLHGLVRNSDMYGVMREALGV